jgi:hypothetical protein
MCLERRGLTHLEARTDLNRVDRKRKVVDTVDLDNVKGVAVDGEDEVGVARQRNKTESVHRC